ncbi:uncharacterized protein LOC126897457 isoform X13 [Daktulosphaira vitifoliae]|uniref:uncharacterized protein LOC126897457 isoform X13 n=1 Tax=Daktulosphaira vitifoliae TaxID=58002 RepID=UPI0021A9C0D0|nr:uncharacterized protein LOC126897457 isoform X13 [Daktulosphaira vitifoliae]
MLLNKVKLILFFIHTINQSNCVDLNDVTCQDIQDLKMQYPYMMHVILKDHPNYIFLYNELKYCPVHFGHEVDYEVVPCEGIEIINRRLEYVITNCFNYERYTLGYAIIVNAIESLCFTYMYQFCEFAIEMNKLGANISLYLDRFSENLKSKIVPIFNKEWISPEPYECILNVYKEHEHKYKNYEFNKVDEKYLSDLLICKNLMKNKVHFLTEPPEKSMNNMSEENLISIQRYNNKIIEKLLTKGSDSYKFITGYKYQTSCLGCTLSNSGNVDNIHIFLPCGHGWSCGYCNVLNKQCPVCDQPITGTQAIHIVTPASIVENGLLHLQPRCVLDGREARCISCRSQIKDVHPPSKHVMIPCGHGWYCSKCIDNTSCTICNGLIKDTFRVKL